MDEGFRLCLSEFCEGLKSVFDSHFANRILLVTVHQVAYSITPEELYKVFSPYGSVEKVIPLQKSIDVQFLIQYQGYGAIAAISSLQGRNIYDGCCRMDIQFADTSSSTSFVEPTQVLESSIITTKVDSSEAPLLEQMSEGFINPAQPTPMKEESMEINDNLQRTEEVSKSLPPMSVIVETNEEPREASKIDTLVAEDVYDPKLFDKRSMREEVSNTKWSNFVEVEQGLLVVQAPISAMLDVSGEIQRVVTNSTRVVILPMEKDTIGSRQVSDSPLTENMDQSRLCLKSGNSSNTNSLIQLVFSGICSMFMNVDKNFKFQDPYAFRLLLMSLLQGVRSLSANKEYVMVKWFYWPSCVVLNVIEVIVVTEREISIADHKSEYICCKDTSFIHEIVVTFIGVDVANESNPVLLLVNYKIGGISTKHHEKLISIRDSDTNSLVHGLRAMGEAEINMLGVAEYALMIINEDEYFVLEVLKQGQVFKLMVVRDKGTCGHLFKSEVDHDRATSDCGMEYTHVKNQALKEVRTITLSPYEFFKASIKDTFETLGEQEKGTSMKKVEHPHILEDLNNTIKIGKGIVSSIVLVLLDSDLRIDGAINDDARYFKEASYRGLNSDPDDVAYIIYIDRQIIQSSLITIDSHVWYASTQKYIDVDDSGLWTEKANLQTKLTDGLSGVRTSSKNAFENLHSRDGNDIGSKRKWIEENMFFGGAITEDSLIEIGEVKLKNKAAMENAIKAIEAFTIMGCKHIEAGIKLFEECYQDGGENSAIINENLLAKAATFYGDGHKQIEEQEELIKLLSQQISDPLTTTSALFEAADVFTVVETQQQRFTLQRLVAMGEKEKSYRQKLAAILNEIEEDVQLFPEPLSRHRSSIHLVVLNGSIIIDLFVVLAVSKRAMGNVWSNHLKKAKMAKVNQGQVSMEKFGLILEVKDCFEEGSIVTNQTENDVVYFSI
ncbi:hypothetical protein GQ457_13G014660 [Hibiscus cannabinus]